LPALLLVSALLLLWPTSPLLARNPHALREITYRQAQAMEEQLAQATRVARPAVVAIHAYRGDEQGQGGFGSGVLLDARGHVLTCAHVVSGSSNLKISTSGGEVHSARLLGIDRIRDVALLVVDGASLPPGGFPAIPRRDLDRAPPALGDWVLALGHPGGPNLDRVPAVAGGRITGAGVQLPASLGTFVEGGLYQTDAPIFNGNSGGPLLDVEGRLIGINNAISLLDRRSFAVPLASIESEIQTWIAHGGQGFLGVQLRELYRQEKLSLGITEGVRISGVSADGPAARAGLEPDDILLSVGSEHTTTLLEAIDAIGRSRPGTVTMLRLVRDGNELTAEVTPEPRAP
jgi:serine protease DegS